VEDCVVPERSTGEDRLVKRHSIESRVSSGDTSSRRNSSGPRGPGDKVRTPWLLQSVATLKKDEAQAKKRKMKDPLVVGGNNWQL